MKKFTKRDKKYLKEIVERDHERVNHMTIKECGLEDECWYHRAIKWIDSQSD